MPPLSNCRFPLYFLAFWPVARGGIFPENYISADLVLFGVGMASKSLQKSVEQHQIYLVPTFCRHFETADFPYIT